MENAGVRMLRAADQLASKTMLNETTFNKTSCIFSTTTTIRTAWVLAAQCCHQGLGDLWVKPALAHPPALVCLHRPSHPSEKLEHLVMFFLSTPEMLWAGWSKKTGEPVGERESSQSWLCSEGSSSLTLLTTPTLHTQGSE